VIDAEEVHSRIKVIDENVLCIYDVPNSTVEIVDAMFAYGDEVTKDWKEVYTVVIMAKNAKLSREASKRVRFRLEHYRSRLVHMALVAEVQTILTVAFRFVAAVNPFWKYSVHKNLDEAMKRIKDVKRHKSVHAQA